MWRDTNVTPDVAGCGVQFFRYREDRLPVLLITLLFACDVIVYALVDGPRRHGELRRAIDGISQKMLTQTLRSMEADGLVSRTVFDRVPPAVEYRLTPLGETLKEPLVAICRWAMEHLPELQQARRTAAR